MRFRANKLFIAGVTMLSAALILAVASTVAFAHGPNDWGQGFFGGMMGGRSGNDGMMGGRGGYGGMMGGYSGWGNADPNAKPISIDEAAQSVGSYLSNWGTPDLKATEVMEFKNNFYAEIEEESTGIHAMELIIDKYTGAVYPEMGPNMMWNTKYGHMGGWGPSMGSMMGGYFGWGTQTGEMTVAPDQAKQYAQDYLDRYDKGATVGGVDRFYGYYTLHTMKDGQITGMLSVNGYNRQVWYHTWHGNFVQMKDLED